MSEVLLKQLIHEVKSLRARMNALETAEVIPSQLQASDGDPNPALSADASGNLVALNGAWIGADAACSWVFDSTNGDVTTLDKVGIGRSDPEVALEVAGDIQCGRDSAGAGKFKHEAEVNWRDAFTIYRAGTQVASIGMNGTPSTELRLHVGATTEDATARLKVTTAGNVWIAADCSALTFTDRP